MWSTFNPLLTQKVFSSIHKEEWATNNYDVGPTGYDDSPVYEWNENFKLADFEQALQVYNEKDSDAFKTSFEFIQEQNEEDDSAKPNFLGESDCQQT